MLTIANKSTKSFASGFLAIGASAATVLAGMGTISAPAQAAQFGCSTAVKFLALQTGDSILCGDKLFDNFRNFFTIENGGADGPLADEVNVIALQVGADWYDLRFQSGKWNVDPGQTIDTSFEYDVTVTDPNKLIKAVDLHLISYGTTGDGAIHVTETVDPLIPGGTSVSLLAGTPPNSDFVEKALVPFQKKISVFKDISLEGHSGTASLSTLGQSYHQTPIPEPSAVLGILAIGGLGLVSWKRKQS